MTTYYALIAVIGLVRLLTTKIFINKDKGNRLFVLLSFLLTVLLQGLRSPTVGTDIQGYLVGYKLCGVSSWGAPVLNYEIGYRTFCKLLYSMGVPEQTFLFIVALICQGAVFLFILRHSKFPACSIVMYLTFGLFTFSFSGLRQMLSIAIVLFGFDNIKNRNFVGFLVFVLIASTFHTSAILLLLAYPLYFIKPAGNVLYLMLGALIVELLFGQRLVALAGYLYGRTIETANTGAYAAFLMYLLVWVASNILIKARGDTAAFINYCYIAALIQGLGRYHGSVARAGYWFAFFVCLLVPQVIASVTSRNWKMRFAMTTVLIGCCLVYFNINTGGGYLNVSPYVPFWE